MADDDACFRPIIYVRGYAMSREEIDDTTADPLRGNWRAMGTACARFPHLIDKWEWQFLSGLQRFPRLSAKQRAILIRIVVRLRAAGCSL